MLIVFFSYKDCELYDMGGGYLEFLLCIVVICDYLMEC